MTVCGIEDSGIDGESVAEPPDSEESPVGPFPRTAVAWASLSLLSIEIKYSFSKGDKISAIWATLDISELEALSIELWHPMQP